MTIRKNPIGVFDSGLGGLTVVKALRQHLPNESFIYFGDTARVPYGSKSPATVKQYAKEIFRFLLSHSVKAVVVACNSATAVALEELEDLSPVPVLGVITPGAKAALAKTRTGKIGVVGTTATISSGAYEKAISLLDENAQVFSTPCPLWVPLAEEGFAGRPEVNSLIRHYLAPLLENDLDTLVLGCTHYPLLVKDIQAVVGGNIQVVEGGQAVARELAAVLGQKGTGQNQAGGNLSCFVTDRVPRFNEFVARFLGEDLQAELVSYETLAATS